MTGACVGWQARVHLFKWGCQSRESAQGMALGDLMVRLDGTQLPSDGDKLNMTMLQDFVVRQLEGMWSRIRFATDASRQSA
eukprot:1156978-Pelagomonas_calceolata.AAC.5